MEFVTNPSSLVSYRKNVERGLNGQFGIFLKNSDINSATEAHFRQQMTDKLKNDNLEEQLIPYWHVGCRRLTPGVGYLEALWEPNVEVVLDGINSIIDRRCLCNDGKEYPIDVLICATGFNTSFRSRFPVRNASGANL
jgi:cation diffusion facilitator CzcD-associated flavoprotein CzcO